MAGWGFRGEEVGETIKEGTEGEEEPQMNTDRDRMTGAGGWVGFALGGDRRNNEGHEDRKSF